MNPENLQQWYKVSDVAKLLSLSTKTVYKLIKEGHLRAHTDRKTGQFRITEDHFKEYTAKRYVESP